MDKYWSLSLDNVHNSAITNNNTNSNKIRG